jgi:acetaldehyde dehydrogenase (acetylating)
MQVWFEPAVGDQLLRRAAVGHAERVPGGLPGLPGRGARRRPRSPQVLSRALREQPMSTDLDLDLRSIQEARDAACGARRAACLHGGRPGDGRPDLRGDGDGGLRRRARLGQMAHEETGYGVADHKRLKNEFAPGRVGLDPRRPDGRGAPPRRGARGRRNIGWPVGVLAALSPSTNPTSTAMFKVLIAVKARNAIVVAPHPSSVRCTAETSGSWPSRGSGRHAGRPGQCLTTVSLPGHQELMDHYATSMILATGGAGMVAAAHSVGKPALGVGPGNVPVYVDRSADVARAAADIVNSKAFDRSTICATEQTVVADAPIADSCAGDEAAGAHWLTREEASHLGRAVPRDGLMDARFVGRSPQASASWPASTSRPTPGSSSPTSRGRARAPVESREADHGARLLVEDGWRAGCERSIELLRFGGDGHSLVIHATDEDVIHAFGMEKPAFRILVNTWGTFGAIGGHHGADAVHDPRPGWYRRCRGQRQHHGAARAQHQATVGPPRRPGVTVRRRQLRPRLLHRSQGRPPCDRQPARGPPGVRGPPARPHRFSDRWTSGAGLTTPS